MRKEQTADGPEGLKVRRPRILVVLRTYLPGVKAGGPIRSIAALAMHLGRELELFVVCRDRDSGDRTAYSNIRVGEWNEVGNAQVMYLQGSEFSAKRYRALLTELQPDVLYLNTMLSVREFVVPAMVARRGFPSVRIVVAPRGCLDPWSLALKRAKKLVFLQMLRWSGLPKGLTWQASTKVEACSIRNAVGEVETVVASDLSMVMHSEGLKLAVADRPPKLPGQLRIVFLSRISPKKNLKYLLERLINVRGEIELTIAGPIEDHSHWAGCQKLIARRLRHVRVRQIGTVAHDDVASVLASSHVFALPTLGENFGHVVLEAFDAGLGVLVSDRTPWRGLERLGAGWDLPLEDPAAWERALQAYCDMDDPTFQAMSVAARSAPGAFLDLDAIKRANLALFCPVARSPGTS
jgi:glycosyltransferase involved in cell wall biosynthesis